MDETLSVLDLLAPGLVHELTNPIAFIASNLQTLEGYQARLRAYDEEVAGLIASLEERDAVADRVDRLAARRRELKLDPLYEDLGRLIQESRAGADRALGLLLCLRVYARRGQPPRSAPLNQVVEGVGALLRAALKHRFGLELALGEGAGGWDHAPELTRALAALALHATAGLEGTLRLATRASAVDDLIELVVVGERTGEAPTSSSVDLAQLRESLRRLPGVGELEVEREPGSTTYRLRLAREGKASDG